MNDISEIRHHIKVIEQTRQITQAMQLISSAKLTKSVKQQEANNLYYRTVRGAIRDILIHSEDIDQSFLRQRETHNAGVVVIAGDKGMAGGYNNNVLALASKCIQDTHAPCTIFTIGQMAREYFTRNGIDVDVEFLHMIQKPTLYNARTVAETLISMYRSELLDEISIVYTHMLSPLVQQPRVLRLLPVVISDFTDVPARFESEELIFQPSAREAIRILIPKYIIGQIYSAMIQAFASEQAARRLAMDKANRNANEIIGRLRLELNRARQATITQELSEIMGGVEVLYGEKN